MTRPRPRRMPKRPTTKDVLVRRVPVGVLAELEAVAKGRGVSRTVVLRDALAEGAKALGSDRREQEGHSEA